MKDTPGVLGLRKLTARIKHALYDGTDHSSLTQHDKLEAIGRDKRDILAGLAVGHDGGIKREL